MLGQANMDTGNYSSIRVCQQAISNCHELHLLENTATPIVQTSLPTGPKEEINILDVSEIQEDFVK